LEAIIDCEATIEFYLECDKCVNDHEILAQDDEANCVPALTARGTITMSSIPPPPSPSPSSHHKKGSLYKQRDFRSGWPVRLFVLDPPLLHYYIDPNDASPRKTIYVVGCDVECDENESVKDSVTGKVSNHAEETLFEEKRCCGVC
jgi:hypothetical protein